MPKPTTQERTRRLVAILGQLKNGARIPVAALAEEIGVTPAELASDLGTLMICGVAPYDPLGLVPVFIEDDEVVVWGDMPGLRGPVRLSSAEARALAAALQSVGFAADDPLTARLIDSAAGSFDAQETAAVVRSAIEGHQSQVYGVLAAAVRDTAVVAIEYTSAGSDAVTDRRIEPVGLFAERGAWYVTAWCRLALGWRTFRIDRIRSAVALAETFDAVNHSGAPSERALDTASLPLARLRFDEREHFVEREWPGGRLIEQLPDGSWIAEVPYAGTTWIARHVLGRLGAVEVLEPADVRSAVARLADDAIRAL